MHKPLVVTLLRDETPESAHLVHAVVRTAAGATEAQFGDASRRVFPRSAIKPLQALPLVESGAAAALGLDDSRLALACASHDHEAVHVQAVRAWLAEICAGPRDLECGIEPPDDAATITDLFQRGAQADTVYNNCSGKHVGFLSVARHLGEPLAGYTEYAHPMQARLRELLAQMCDADTDSAPWARDGCSIPTMALPLSAWALGIARMAGAEGIDDRRAEAASRLSAAIAANPRMIGGEKSWDTQLVRATRGRLLVKRGAEGVACGWMPGTGTGFCMKVADGASRALPVAIGRLVRTMGWLDEETLKRCINLFETPVGNWNGFTVGRICAAE